MKFEFNTGRPYGADGQWIEVERVGDWVYFNDRTRMIDGHFHCMEQDTNERNLREKVMMVYDHSLYTYGRPSQWSSL
jgi:hypothetical protein